MKQLILASGSPRRKQLLEQALLTFSISTSSVEEHFDENLLPFQVVETLANEKAEDVYMKNPNSVVIGADTIVSINNEILGKPNSKEEAYLMLKRLSGKTHSVFTGVAIVSTEQRSVFHEKTLVTFWDLSNEEIERYVASGEPFDKAGSYGIQGLGALLVKEIKGDYFNVVGLPLARTVRELKNFPIVSSNRE